MKKVLILTLGTGITVLDQFEDVKGKTEQERQEALRKRLQDSSVLKTLNYRRANYRFADRTDKEEINTEFVAEVLIKEVKPDFVFILGTIKSCWTNFYIKYSDLLNEEDVLRLDGIECHGDEVEVEDLRRYNSEINKIYAGKIGTQLFGEGNTDTMLRTVLLRYGVNNQQLKENYEIISNMWKSMDIEETYLVSFDITHSFRSLPIYNLSLLDYLRQVADYNITIDHVYYGNIELIREKGYAPIVDLADLVDVMNLSKGVSEFKEVGNSRTLVEQIPENMEALKESLQRFYWSVQMNDVAEISRSINDLLLKLDTLPKSSDRYVDLGNMIRSALHDMLGSRPEDYRKIDMPEQVYRLNYLLAKWHREKNRYYNAANASYESFKIFITCVYLENKVKPPIKYDKNNFSDGKTRGAFEQFKVRFRDKKINPECLNSLLEDLELVGKVRNMGAHGIVEEVEDKPTIEKAKAAIDRFIDALEKLYSLDEEELSEFKNTYLNIQASVQPGLVTDSKSTVQEEPLLQTTEHAVLITDPKRVNEEYIKGLRLKGNLSVLYLDDNVYNAMCGEKLQHYQWTLGALALSVYMMAQGINYGDSVYIDFPEVDKAYYYALALGFRLMRNVNYSVGNGRFKHINYTIEYGDKPNIGLYQFTFNKWCVEKADKEAEGLRYIPPKTWEG